MQRTGRSVPFCDDDDDCRWKSRESDKNASQKSERLQSRNITIGNKMEERATCLLTPGKLSSPRVFLNVFMAERAALWLLLDAAVGLQTVMFSLWFDSRSGMLLMHFFSQQAARTLIFDWSVAPSQQQCDQEVSFLSITKQNTIEPSLGSFYSAWIVNVGCMYSKWSFLRSTAQCISSWFPSWFVQEEWTISFSIVSLQFPFNRITDFAKGSFLP